MKILKKDPIIFVVSGKSGSGKDTTCKIINDYVNSKNLKSINLQFSSYIKMYVKNITDWNGDEETKPRTLLQELGTEVIRNNIDNNFFIRRIIDDIKVYSYYFDVITISDARLPEELENISNEFKNVYKVGVKRKNVINKLNDMQNAHHTEVALDNYYNYDYVINNEEGIDVLKENVINIMNEVL